MKSGASGVKKGWGTLGGNQHMIGFDGSGTQKSGSSSQEGSGGRRDQKAPTGSAHGFYSSGSSNKDYAGTQAAGVSGSTPTGGNDKFAKGGSTKMFGNRGSQRCEGGKSAC
jgi:hypothetical protein